MKSPITGKEMRKEVRKEKLTYRKEEFEIRYHVYVCDDSKEHFTDDELDALNTNQIYNQYREKHGIPFPNEIREIREKYKLSASKMSDILGLGANSYRLYESGEMPSVSNGRLILAVKHPKEFIKQLEASSSLLDPYEFAELINYTNTIYNEEKKTLKIEALSFTMENADTPNEFNGFRKPDFEKISQIINYYSRVMELLKTKLNKLLFYTDFLFFKNNAYSMTGLTYKAIPLGPVPSDYELLYTKLERDDKIIKNEKAYDNGIIGEVIQGIKQNDDFNFNDKETEILNKIINKFKETTATQIKDLSHNEKGWIENEKERKKISYQKYAYDLVGI